MKRWIITSLILIGSGLLLLLRPPASQAQPRYLMRLVEHYPHLEGTRLNDCIVCHARGVAGGAANAFAEDYFDKGFSFSNIEEMDSDEDGFTNLEELMAGTFPGNPDSVPSSADEAPAGPTSPSSSARPSPASRQETLAEPSTGPTSPSSSARPSPAPRQETLAEPFAGPTSPSSSVRLSPAPRQKTLAEPSTGPTSIPPSPASTPLPSNTLAAPPVEIQVFLGIIMGLAVATFVLAWRMPSNK